MRKVLITRRIPNIAENILSNSFEVNQIKDNKPLSREKLISAVQKYDAILSTVTEKFDRTVLTKSKKLKVISNYAVGLDNIDLDFAQSLGITTYNTPDSVTNSTADHTLALLLSLIRMIPAAMKYVKNDKWKMWDPERFLGEELTDKTLGIIGFGKIGQAVARRAIGFGLKIVYYNHSKKIVDPAIGPYVSSLKFDEVLQSADYLSLHLPLTPKTKEMINKETINKMEKQPILINMARGDIVKTDDLVEALKSGRIRGAGLDVTSPEPLPGDHPLCHLNNCIIVPHIGTATQECRNNMARLAAHNIINHFS